MRIENKNPTQKMYVISVSTRNPWDYKDTPLAKEFIYEVDVRNADWTLTPLMYKAELFTLAEASKIVCVLNKINKCYFEIVPTFETQYIESKLNTFDDE